MPITLQHDSTVHTLPDALIWTDSHKWSAVQGAHQWSTTGALLIDQGLRLAGRPITLEGGPQHAWMPRSQADALRALAATPGAVMTLTLHDASTYSVMWDYSREQPFEAEQVVDYSDPLNTDWCVPKLRLIEI